MPLILVEEPKQPARLFEVRSNRVRIGRSGDSELVLPNVAVSRSHAVLEHGPEGTVQLTPLSSRNPVMVGTSDLKGATTLSHGDRFVIGRYRLTWFHEKQLDAYKLHQLAEMPRYVGARKRWDEETFNIPAELRRRYAAFDELRERGALISADGESHRLGAEIKEVGPGAAIPCGVRLGRWTAARLSWGGAGHVVERVGLFARVEVDGQAITDHRLLAPGQKLSVNGTVYTYDLAPSPR
jgi:pSer/pThr/pTyr-binding forkhead associated (FHA) protein